MKDFLMFFLLLFFSIALVLFWTPLALTFIISAKTKTYFVFSLERNEVE